jgi:hypothetical protein
MFYRPRIGMAAIIGTPAERSAMTRLGARAVVIGVSAWGVLAARASAAGRQALLDRTGAGA